MARKTQQNSITSPELIAQINPENIRLLEDFLMYLKSTQKSDKTIKGYINDLEIFFCWNINNANNKFFIDINKRDIIAYQNFLLYTNNNSPARIRRLKATLSSLSNYICNVLDDVYLNFKNVINKIENPKNQPVREKTVIEEEQLNFIFETLKEKGKFQILCATALAAFSGSRKSELVRFKVDFFKDENVILGSLYKTPKIKTKGRSGGKFINKFVLKNEFKPYLDLWLNQREKLGINSEWLFVSKNKNGEWEQLKAETLNSWALTLSKIAGLDIYFHSFRHLWTTSLVKKGLPNNVIKDLTGWESEAMCSVYIDLSEEDTFSKYFDENGIKKVDKKSLTDL